MCINMSAFRLIALIAVMISVSGCGSQDDPVLCTEEYRTIAVEILGGELDNWRTIRLSTQDTFKLVTTFQNKYPILDDAFVRTLNQAEEQFQFQGILDDSVRVDEVYSISADACHIQYVSGSLRVSL